jgi:hypothetical protein
MAFPFSVHTTGQEALEQIEGTLNEIDPAWREVLKTFDWRARTEDRLRPVG